MVTSRTCGHCTRFKNQQLQPLLDLLKSNNNLTIVNIDFPENKVMEYLKPNIIKDIYKVIQGQYVPINMGIGKLITGFPQFFLFTLDNYKSGKLLGDSFNNETDSFGNMTRSKVTLPITADNLNNFITQIINKQPINKQVVSNQPVSNQPINIDKPINKPASVPGYLFPSNYKPKISYSDE
jgi:hypothetical protein